VSRILSGILVLRPAFLAHSSGQEDWFIEENDRINFTKNGK
jgi:hypothetical protein